MGNSRALRSLISRHVIPDLDQVGFDGRWPHYARAVGERLDTVAFWGYRGQYFIDLGVDFAFLYQRKRRWRKNLDVTAWSAEFRGRLKPPGAHDFAFPYGASRAEAEVAVANMRNLFASAGLGFFNRFEPMPAAVRSVTPTQLIRDPNSISDLGTGARLCLVLARIWEHYDDPERSVRFARKGLILTRFRGHRDCAANAA